MERKNQVVKNLYAWVLLVALILPATIQFIHSFECHSHVSLIDQKADIHNDVDTCELCAFQLASFNYSINEYPDLNLPEITVKLKNHFITSHAKLSKFSFKKLRAPPIN